jgi:hypothetical protein
MVVRGGAQPVSKTGPTARSWVRLLLYRIERGLFQAQVQQAEAALKRSQAAKTLSTLRSIDCTNRFRREVNATGGKLFPAQSYRMELVIRLNRRSSITMPFRAPISRQRRYHSSACRLSAEASGD